MCSLQNRYDHFNTIKEDVREIVMEVIKEFKESYDKEINDVSISLIDEMAIETLIDYCMIKKKNYLFMKIPFILSQRRF